MVHVWQGVLREFADRHQVSCSLATDDGVEMVYLECTRSSARKSRVHPGRKRST